MSPLLLASSVLTVTSILVFKVISKFQDAAYMDEIFHIPQAQVYCAGNFTQWDPMITTLPGLYLSSLALLHPISLLVQAELTDLCTVENLRSINVLYNICNFILLYHLSQKLHDKQERISQSCHLLNAGILTLLPVLYFFSFLYYTDPGATFFTLLMYNQTIKKQHFTAALAGAVAILFRQTNVIWVLFASALAKFDVLENHVKARQSRKSLNSMDDIEGIKVIFRIMFESWQSFFTLLKDVLINIFWYLLVLIGFAVFVYINKGIVVGDRSNHKPVLNFPQFLYFISISGAFSFIHMISVTKVKRFIVAVVEHPIRFLMVASLMFVLVYNFTYEHKYTLSDNRHYTFYVWSKIYRRNEFTRYFLIPGYIYCLYQFYSLLHHKGFLWHCAMFVCTLAVLVPQALFEFRYYIIPFAIIRLNMRVSCSKLLLLELLLYCLINVFTVYMFLYKPFLWSNSDDMQRFMW